MGRAGAKGHEATQRGPLPLVRATIMRTGLDSRFHGARHRTLPLLSKRVSDEGAVISLAPVRAVSSDALPKTARPFPFSSKEAHGGAQFAANQSDAWVSVLVDEHYEGTVLGDK